VANKHFLDICDLWDPKFNITPRQKVVTYGSCFAQYIGRALESRDYLWRRTELAPRGLSENSKIAFGYEMFSARTGNIYTTTLLLQWIKWAIGEAKLPDEIWYKEGRMYDPMRPNIEPNGFDSVDEARQSFGVAVESFRRSLVQADFLVFTMGLTESWHNTATDFEYPMCPGTVAGEFDPSIHKFQNLSFDHIKSSLVQAIGLVRELNPSINFILTVSPVPLTATMSGKHVLVATMESKSILRSVASTVVNECAHVDYFPSYEIINSPAYKGMFFQPNLRSVNQVGVRHVMDEFFRGIENKFGKDKKSIAQENLVDEDFEEVCEEEFLEGLNK